LRVADLSLDPARREVRRNGRTVSLTTREYALLEYFMRNPGRVLTRPMIAEHVWGLDFDAESNIIDVYIGYLRRKIDDDAPSQPPPPARGEGSVQNRTAGRIAHPPPPHPLVHGDPLRDPGGDQRTVLLAAGLEPDQRPRRFPPHRRTDRARRGLGPFRDAARRGRGRRARDARTRVLRPFLPPHRSRWPAAGALHVLRRPGPATVRERPARCPAGGAHLRVGAPRRRRGGANPRHPHPARRPARPH